MEQSMRERLSPILEGQRRHRESLIPVLQKVQGELGYLPEEAVSEIAHFLGLASSDIFGVASFYSQFRFERQGEHTVKVCQGTACHVRGAKRIMETVVQELGIQPGGTTEDYKFSLEKVACFGSCALAPVMVVDDQVYGRMATPKARQVLTEY
ncbi:MAG: NADH-quinone oxidoreductase subunit NuoE [Dehalococcoidales bacterium]|nr:MAG: NADH-quinone oxidoreductase subunit NuoE [Dehalococcoidales bacterium]